jgi:hypothetical protein
MPNLTTEIRWLNTRYQALLEDLRNNSSNEIYENIVELFTLNQQIQAQLLLHLLSQIKQTQQDTDKQLMELSLYLQDIVMSHIKEAENLEKAR